MSARKRVLDYTLTYSPRQKTVLYEVFDCRSGLTIAKGKSFLGEEAAKRLAVAAIAKQEG